MDVIMLFFQMVFGCMLRLLVVVCRVLVVLRIKLIIIFCFSSFIDFLVCSSRLVLGLLLNMKLLRF